MTLSIRVAVRSGGSRAFTRNGIVLILVYLFVVLLEVALSILLTESFLPLNSITTPVASGPRGPPATPILGTELPTVIALQVAFLVEFIGGFLTIPVLVVATRVFVSDYTERIPDEFVFHRLGWATLNRFFGGWIVAFSFAFISLLLLGIGFFVLFTLITRSALLFLTTALLGRLLIALFGLVLLIPGVLLGVGLIFVGQEIAIRDKNLPAAFAGSWRIVKQNRLALFVIAIITLVLQIVISYLTFTVLPGVFAQAIASGETAILHIIVVAIMARVYLQAIDGELNPRFSKPSE